MNTFKRKSLYAALGGLVVAGAAGTANAVYVNPEGLGQALVYPYYTVRNGNDTLISVVNSTASAKVVKVRFLEGKNSKEVLDFNLFMSPFDVWTAAISATANAAKIATTDRSCTVPGLPSGGQEFRNLLFVAAEGDTSLDRTREGYVEILEMGVIASTTLETSVTHVNGVPPCTGLPTNTVAAGVLVPPTGGLFGSGTIINVAAGTDFSYDPVAFDQWSSTVSFGGPASITPNLASAADPVSTVVSRTEAVFATWGTSGADAVSSTIMHDKVYNEYVIDPAIKAGTDWIIAFPTKRFYVPLGSGTNTGKLFQRNFANGTGSCDDITLAYYDREERKPGSTVDFSPSASPQGPQLCWEVNVVTFGNSNVFASKLAQNIDPKDPVTGATYASGWAVIGFPLITGQPAAHNLISGPGLSFSLSGAGGSSGISSATFAGLPSIGFSAQQYFNGTVGTPAVQSNYGGSFLHKQTKSITTTVSFN